MEKPTCSEFKPGRFLAGRLLCNHDLIASIQDFCQTFSIQMATFSIIGAVSSATIGAYDQTQQVYVTAVEDAPFEIITCVGNVSLKDNAPFVHAHIVLGNMHGKTIGGHLFSKTIVFAAEISLQELSGNPLERAYDQTTGLSLWKF